jgi:hypothetical protein
MRKSFLLLIMVLLVLLLTSCSIFEPDPPSVSFAEVSQPYLNQYGPPEEVNTYDSTGYHTVDWWWWSKGFEVTFINTDYDDVNGWAVDSTYSFEPI